MCGITCKVNLLHDRDGLIGIPFSRFKDHSGVVNTALGTKVRRDLKNLITKTTTPHAPASTY